MICEFSLLIIDQEISQRNNCTGELLVASLLVSLPSIEFHLAFFALFFFFVSFSNLPKRFSPSCVSFLKVLNFFSKFISPIKKAFLTEDVALRNENEATFIMTRLKDVMKFFSLLASRFSLSKPTCVMTFWFFHVKNSKAQEKIRLGRLGWEGREKRFWLI